MIKTIVETQTGKELRCQFDEEIGENETMIYSLRTEVMENPHWDFENNIFYDKLH
jgi:hypothetical protein